MTWQAWCSVWPALVFAVLLPLAAELYFSSLQSVTECQIVDKEVLGQLPPIQVW